MCVPWLHELACQGVDVYGNLDATGNLVFYERRDSRADYEKYLAWRTEIGTMDFIRSKLKAPPKIRYFEWSDT